MKLLDVVKVFGAAAVIAGLTPYRVTKNEETGERKVRALFWEATSGNSKDEVRNVSVDVGFFSPLKKDDGEAYLFADELTVEYSKKEESAAVEEKITDEAEAPEESVEEPVEEVPAEEPAEAEEVKTPEEESAKEN